MSATPLDDDGTARPVEVIAERMAQQIRRLLAGTPAPGLYLVATPIGHLGDVTLRAIAVLAAVDVIYCEDTRRTRILLDAYGIERPLRPYHEHNAAKERPAILRRLTDGGRLALVSDAGTPLISDPGFKLVREAIAQGCAVTSLPGASAVLVALTSSGLPTDSFHFAGFLPPRSAARRARLAALAAIPATLVVFETAARLAASLADMADVLGARPAVIARELTKLHEEIVRGPLPELTAAARDVVGEVVIVVGPPDVRAVSDEAILAALAQELTDASLKDAARIVAAALGIPRSRAYDLGIAMKRARE